MKGDFSRNTFKPAKHFSGVRLQQGRVQLDADWNEQVDIQTHQLQTGSRDIVGMAGVPAASGNFELSGWSGTDDFIIAPGRIYVEGVLCSLEESQSCLILSFESESSIIRVAKNVAEPPFQAGELILIHAVDSAKSWKYRIAQVKSDNQLKLNKNVPAKLDGTKLILRRITTFRHQPDYPNPAPGLQNDHKYLAYLDVWERHLTAIEDPTLREEALGGPDTATRTKTVWQVKLVDLRDSTARQRLGLLPPNMTPSTTLSAPGMLKARCDKSESTDLHYSIESGGGYQGPENQLYRVEIHTGGEIGQGSGEKPTFKWSRENGSVVTAWSGQNGDTLTVGSIGLDENLKFAPGQWIELTDDAHELRGEPGIFVQIENVAERTINIKSAANGDQGNGPAEGANEQTWYDRLAPTRKIRRWDFSAKPEDMVLEPTTVDGWIPLEHGIKIKFEPGRYTTGDYWLIPARRSRANIEWPHDQKDNPLPQPPNGIGHHQASLATLEFKNGQFKVIRDYRQAFRPLAAQELIYLSGDGQAAMPDKLLPQGLRVSIGRQPMAGARVCFKIEGDGGSLHKTQGTKSSGQSKLTVPTNRAGEAVCYWKMPTFYDAGPAQEARRTGLRVKATAVDENGQPLDVGAVYFTASLSLAEEEAYEPRGRGAGSPRQMEGAGTVQGGLDRLDDIKVNVHGHDKMEGPLGIAKTLAVGKGLTVGRKGDKWEGGNPLTTLHGGLKVAGGSKDTFRDLLVEGSALIHEDLEILGSITVRGQATALDVEAQSGRIQLGDDKKDRIMFHGILSSPGPDPVFFDDDIKLTGSLIVDGKVGIGTTDPQARLHVGGPLRVDGNRVIIDGFGDDGYHWFKTAGDERGSLFMGFQGSPNGPATAVQIAPGDSLGLTVTGGQVGIGTTAPAEKLHVTGGALRVDTDAMEGRIPSLELRRYLGEQFDGTALTVDVGMGSGLVNLVGGAVLADSGDRHLYLGERGASRISLGDGSLHLFTGDGERIAEGEVSWHRRFSITRDGNIHIRPGSSGGRLRVEGPSEIGGDLLVAGDAALNTLEVADSRIHLNHYPVADDTQAPLDIDAGLEVFRGGSDPARLMWDEGDDRWKIGMGDGLKQIATIDRLPSGIARVIRQPGHGFTPAQAVFFDAIRGEQGEYVPAQSDTGTTTGMFIISWVGKNADNLDEPDCFTLVQAGFVDFAPMRSEFSFMTFSRGEFYYVSETEPGALTAEEPLQISNPIFYAVSPDSGYVLPYRPSESFQLQWSQMRVIGAHPDAPEGTLFVDSTGKVGIGKSAPEAKLDVAGSIKSPMWNVNTIFDSQPGELPLNGAFKTGGGTLLVLVSGSGFALEAQQQVGMRILIDGDEKGFVKSFANEVDIHKTFATNNMLVTGVPDGEHTIVLESWNETKTDQNDFFNVSILELPF